VEAPPRLPPAVYVWSLALARSAVECAAAQESSLLLLCPQESAVMGGVPWFKALAERARENIEINMLAGLEAGDDAALAFEAIQAGLDLLIFTGPPDVTTRLAAIAEKQKALLLDRAPQALVLASARDPEQALRSWLNR